MKIFVSLQLVVLLEPAAYFSTDHLPKRECPFRDDRGRKEKAALAP